MMVVRTTGAVIAWLALAGVLSAQPSPTFQDIETSVLAARQLIRSGHCIIDRSMLSKQEADGPIEASTTQIQTRYEFWFSGDRVRLQVRHVQDGDMAPAYEKLECVNFDGRGKDFRYDGDPKAVAYQGRGMRDAKELYEVFDPRLIGCIDNDLNSLRFRNQTFEDVFGGPKVVRQDVRCEASRYDGEDAILVAWVQPPSPDQAARGLIRPTRRELWVSPAKGHNILRSVSWETGSTGQDVWRYEITNTLAQYDGIWYISGYRVQKKSGSRTATETVRVILAEFNQAGIEQAFELRNFGLKPGQGIWDKDLKKRIVYDGDNVRVNVEEELAKASANAIPLTPVPGSTNYWLVTLCVGAAAVGAMLLYRVLSRSRS